MNGYSLTLLKTVRRWETEILCSVEKRSYEHVEAKTFAEAKNYFVIQFQESIHIYRKISCNDFFPNQLLIGLQISLHSRNFTPFSRDFDSKNNPVLRCIIHNHHYINFHISYRELGALT